MPGRVSRLRRTVAAFGVAVTLGPLVGCGLLGGDDPELHAEPLPPSAVVPAPPAGLERYYEQELDWRSCRESMECAQMKVPLDYERPAEESITLMLLRQPATHDDQRIGAMVVNPGGPGASGVDYAAAAESFFGPELRAAFDIVGVDPRGVGSSTPIDCLSDQRLDEMLASDPTPDNRREAREGKAQARALGHGCLERSGDLAGHVSTAEAARDLDVVRALLGQERLVYFGASYGTHLGAAYADLFPDRVGRMVLDGAVDPSLDVVEERLIQAQGFEVALRAYVEHCVEDGDCFLGRAVEEGLGTIQGLLAGLDAEPIPGDPARELTEGLATLGIWRPLYNERDWDLLDAGLSQALDGEGRTLLALADSYVHRGPKGYEDNAIEALYAVSCLDPGRRVSMREARSMVPEFTAASPTFGRGFAYGLTACGSWPVGSGKEPPELTGRGAAPILVVGTSRDPATPLAWAKSLADQLESGVLVRRDGDGHTGYGAGNGCVDETVEKYLVSGEVPAGQVDC